MKFWAVRPNKRKSLPSGGGLIPCLLFYLVFFLSPFSRPFHGPSSVYSSMMVYFTLTLSIPFGFDSKWGYQHGARFHLFPGKVFQLQQKTHWCFFLSGPGYSVFGLPRETKRTPSSAVAESVPPDSSPFRVDPPKTNHQAFLSERSGFGESSCNDFLLLGWVGFEWLPQVLVQSYEYAEEKARAPRRACHSQVSRLPGWRLAACPF